MKNVELEKTFCINFIIQRGASVTCVTFRRSDKKLVKRSPTTKSKQQTLSNKNKSWSTQSNSVIYDVKKIYDSICEAVYFCQWTYGAIIWGSRRLQSLQIFMNIAGLFLLHNKTF